MHICMRTTLDLEDQLLIKARRKAVERETTLTEIVEEALRFYLTAARKPVRRMTSRWVVVSGTREPDVDIADRDRLYDALEGRRP
jgi:hypothetical protein